MKPKSTKPPMQQTRAARAGRRIKALVAERHESHADAARSTELIARMREQQNLLELQNTQLSEAQADLEQSQHRYADLYNLAPLGYLTLDRKGCIREINHTGAELIGHPITHLIGRPIVPYLAPPDRREFLKHLWQCQHDQKEHRTTLRLRRPGGDERVVEFTTQPSRDFDTHQGWCRSAITDVTERHAIQAALSDSEAKFRLLAENMGEVFWFMELDPPRVTYVSPAFEQIWGVPVAALYADHRRWEQSIHPDDLPIFHAAYHHWAAGETGEHFVEYRVVRPEGDVRWIADRGIVITRRAGVPHQISGIASDITARKEAEAAVRASEERFRGFFENVGVGTAQMDGNGRYVRVNDRLCAITGYDREDLLGGMGPLDLIHPDDQDLARSLLIPFLRGESDQYESDKRYVRKDGTIVWVHVSGSAIRGADGGIRFGAAVVADITERKRAEQVIRRLNDELESRVEVRTLQLQRLNAELQCQIDVRRRLEEEILEISEREQQRIGRDLHDDLGQQLAGAWMMSTVLEKGLSSRDAPERSIASRISDLLSNAVALTRSLARGLHPVAAEPGGLTVALRDLAARMHEMFRVDCRCRCDSEVSVDDNTTATHLYRIAQEAVSNGIKHGRAKKVRIRLSAGTGTIALVIKDDGTGIGPPDANRRGMGLRIMHYRADLIGASLRIERQESGGTCVTCILPQPTPLETQEAPHGKKNSAKNGRTREEKGARRR